MNAFTTTQIKKKIGTASIKKIEQQTVSFNCGVCKTRIWFWEQFTDNLPTIVSCPNCGKETLNRFKV